MKSEVSITLYFQPCSAHYTAAQINKFSKTTSAIKRVTINNMNDIHYKGSYLLHVTSKSTLFTSVKEKIKP